MKNIGTEEQTCPLFSQTQLTKINGWAAANSNRKVKELKEEITKLKLELESLKLPKVS